MFIRATVLAAVLIGAATSVAAQTFDYAESRSIEAAQEAPALADATLALCDRTLVLLGENGFHGDGRTNAFKADLVRNLVTECAFDAVVFEGSLYDFIAFNRAVRRGDATPGMLSSAVGGLWNQNREMQDLIGFLFAHARDGHVLLAGMDDQLGGRGMFYSLEQMPLELAAFLPADRRETCAAGLKQRIWSQYSAADPYTEDRRAALRACLSEIDAAVAIARLNDPAERAEYRDMIAGFGRALDRDFVDHPQRIQGRDHAMFRNLEAVADALPEGAKIVVWSANSHVARDASATEAFRDHPNMGALVDRRFGDEAFAVGFSAAGGSYRYTVRTAREVPAVAPGSLEAVALTEPTAEVVWMGPAALAALPPVAGSTFDDHQPLTANWDEIYDAVVVFRSERPPHRLDEESALPLRRN